MGAAVVGATYLFNQSTTEPEQSKSSASYLEEVSQACTEAAQNYLTRFSTQACSMVRQYQEIAEKIINSDVNEKPLKLTTQHHQLQLLQMLWDNLNQELESVKTKSAD